MNRPVVTDAGIERVVSIVLRTGVSISGAIVLVGGIYYVLRHASENAAYHIFHGQPSIDRTIDQIARGAVALRARSIIQFGILVLIATPILRVLFSLVGFVFERDRTYVLVTAIVLLVLLYSLVSGTVSG
jgi:uncharacterized membrane protein